jgi:hypothetical protein
MKRRFAVALFCCLIAVAVLGIGVPVANAAPTSATSNISLHGTTLDENFGTLSITCDECLPDDFFDCGDGCEIAGRVEATPSTSVEWTAPLSVDTTWDPEDLHQGATADVSNSLTPGAGTVTLHYTIPWIAGIFGRNGDFPAGPGWTPSTDTISGTEHIDVSATCTPSLQGDGNAVCTAAPVTFNVLDEWPDPSAPVDVTVDLIFNHTFTIGDAPVVNVRSATNMTDEVLNFSTPAPSVVGDQVDIPCSATIGSPVDYTLGPTSYHPSSILVGAGAQLHYFIDGPGPLNGEDTVDLINGTVFDSAVAGSMTMTGGPADPVELGEVQADNVAPTVNSIVQGGTFLEGSDVSFTGVVTDNCPTGLAFAWRFSDGGTAFTQVAHHAFADDGATYTGLLRLTDLAGNTTLSDFDVEDIGNVDPNVTGPPNVTALWGVPVSFHASATDPGSADQSTLSFAWTFGDGAGAAGADVGHAYASPGSYPVVITVSDKDGGVGTAGLTATIAKRASTLVYTGATQGLPNKYTTLSATLNDQLGQAISGRLVTFTLGTQTATAATNSSGVAVVSIRLNQKIGVYPLNASFAGDSLYYADGADPGTYRIGK